MRVRKPLTSALTKATPDSASLRTTVPFPVCESMLLENKDELIWTMKDKDTWIVTKKR